MDSSLQDRDSALGTKEYWDRLYKQEVQNFKDHGDEGEIWFGKSSEKRIVDWLRQNSVLISPAATILDLGCGNGSLLRILHKQGFDNLNGIDYSEDAVKLAQMINNEAKLKIKAQVADILSPQSELIDRFDLLIDKGTYDAISLMQNGAKHTKIYRENVLKFAKPGCGKKYLILVSCNYTKEELVTWFCQDGLYSFHCDLPPAPSFTFGGKSGSTVAGVVFEILK